MEDTVLTPQEVADILKIAKNTVYELIKRGELNAYRVGKKVRVDMQDVEEYKNRTKTIKREVYSRQYNHEIPSASSPVLDEPAGNNSFVICGQDILLDNLAQHLQAYPGGKQVLRSYEGSYNGLYSLYKGTVQLATCHLWDGDSGEYNIPYVRRLLPGIPTVIFHLACRNQGFYVQKGNPKKISGWEDLKREDISIINREKGSGTRILLDEYLRKLQINAHRIKGYERESTSHLAIASMIARGGADMGMGNEKMTHQVSGIDFVPLQKERYEMVVKKEDISKPQFQAVIEIIRSSSFKNELQGIGGYDLKEIGSVITEL